MTKKKITIGLDLGSYNSTVATYVDGDVKVIPNSEGSLTTPSIVSISNTGEILVGEPARRQGALHPKNTIFNIKRLMGKTYDQVKHLKRPYDIVDNNGKAAVKINDKIYSPEEISAMIVNKMKKTAEEYIGEKVTQIVVTCPAYFNSEERNSTKLACEIAGLEVLRVINEPTAAILNVKSTNAKKYGVLDFGGATLDFSVIDAADGVFEILATDGDIDLGGSLIDQEIVNHLAEEFLKENGTDLRKDPQAFQRLFEASEKAKIELSNTTSTDINLPYITSIDNVPKHLTYKLTRAKLEQLSEPIINRVIEKTKTSLEKSGLKISEIDEVLLVGGSTRIPILQSKIEALINKKPNKSLNPDLCVSEGACIQGGIISGDVTDILLLDVIPISLGIETLGNLTTILVPSNTTIPTTKKEIFSTAADNQPSVQITVLQGERSLAKDNKVLGTFTLDNIPPAQRGVPKIEVTFDIDANSILHVSAKDLGTGKEQKIKIESSTLSDEEINRIKDEAKANEKADKEQKEKINMINDADNMVFQIEKTLKEMEDKISETEKTEVNTLITEIREAIKTNSDKTVKNKITTLKDKWSAIVSKIYKPNETPDGNTVFEDIKSGMGM